ncbi:MAG TPA: prolyl oligopeptidase family serine peptidase [Steroidobacteraceae bacterium]|nr:prolyl oligopeptidase family serine peptidase [Steroidobacteraceae bacterium]
MTRPFNVLRRALTACAAALLAATVLGRPPAPEPPAPEQPAPPPQSPSPAAGPTEPQPAAAAQPAEPGGAVAPAAPAPAATPSHLPPLVPRRERGNLVFDNVPASDQALGARLGRYLESRQASLLDWLPDGSLLIATRFGETEQLHRVAGPMGAREQLTFYPEPVNFARAAPASGGLVYLKDQGGDENSQLYYQAADGGVRELTHGDFLHGNPVWAHDGRRVAFYGSDRDGASYDIYIADVTSGAAPRLIVGGKQGAWYPLDWSVDDGKLLVWRYLSVSEGYLYIADPASGALTPLETSGRKIGIRGAKFAPDGRGVYVLSDEDDEFVHLRLIDPVTHQTRRITPDTGWDVEDFDVSVDGRYVAYVVNHDGRSRLTLQDTQTHAEVSPPGLPEGVITRVLFDRAARRLALAVESPGSPRDVYSYDLEHQRLERWTRSEAGPLDNRALIAPELVHFATWDRVAGHPRLLSAYVYRPRNVVRCPVVIDIHGGPESQFRPGWDPFIQFLVGELGYAVVAPNVRGSSGYGKSFLALDNGELREDAVRDIGSLLVWIGAQPAFDRERISVMGASYGGYLTLASLVTYGERLRGGIDVVGISNFVAFLSGTAPYRRDLRRAEYGDERDPRTRAFLERISPLTNASRIKRPLLVVDGLNDPRVPASESEQLVWRVRAAGGEVWYLVAKDEGHGFRKKANRDAYLGTAAAFLQKLAR